MSNNIRPLAVVMIASGLVAEAVGVWVTLRSDLTTGLPVMVSGLMLLVLGVVFMTMRAD